MPSKPARKGEGLTESRSVGSGLDPSKEELRRRKGTSEPSDIIAVLQEQEKSRSAVVED